MSDNFEPIAQAFETWAGTATPANQSEEGQLLRIASAVSSLAATGGGPASPSPFDSPFTLATDFYEPTDADFGFAIERALAALKAGVEAPEGAIYKGSGPLLIPAGDYSCGSRKIDITHTLRLMGQGSGLAGGAVTRLRFTPGGGFRVQRYNTQGARQMLFPTGVGGDGTIIEGLWIDGGYSGTPASGNHGIDLIARAEVRDCQIYDFGGNGINVVASTGGGAGIEGNANCSMFSSLRIGNCKDGMYFDGADANACNTIGADCSGNREWGIRDDSFLGNAFTGCHTSANVSGPYKTSNVNACSVFVACYSEGDQPPSQIQRPSMVLGGLHGAGVVGGSYIAGGNDDFGIRMFAPINVEGAAFGDLNIRSSSHQRIFFLKGGVDAGSIVASDGRMFFNQPAGQYFDFRVNGVQPATIDANGINFPAGKTINFASLTNAANDAAAATAGVPVGSVYRNGSALMVRVA